VKCPTCQAYNLPDAAFCSQCATRLSAIAPAPMYRYASRGTTILVLGIISVTVCHLIGPVAWSMGNEELRRIQAGESPDSGQQGATAGKICGIVSSVLLIITALVVGFLLIAIRADPGPH
jgi:hypothetical protein